jgi:hypothetical protein
MHDARRCQHIPAAALEINVMAAQAAARLAGACEVDMQPVAACGAHKRLCASDQPGTLQPAEGGEPVPGRAVVVHVQDVRAGRPGGDRHVGVRPAGPPPAYHAGVAGPIPEPVPMPAALAPAGARAVGGRDDRRLAQAPAGVRAVRPVRPGREGPPACRGVDQRGLQHLIRPGAHAAPHSMRAPRPCVQATANAARTSRS